MDRSHVARLPLLRAPRLRLIRFPRVKPVVILFLVLAMALAGGAWIRFRSSFFVSVQRVQILGVHGREATAIDGALRDAALGMSTLDASVQELRNAVAGFPLVRSVSMSTSFPHAMKITVQERRPVAVLSAEGARSAIAGDGVVLGEALVSSSLPVISGPTLLPRTGTRLHSATLRSYLTVLGAAPHPIERFVTKAYEGPEGLTVKMKNGLLVYFGDDSRPHAKWLSLASVLADESSAGAAYIDVRLPERPVAGTNTTTEPGTGESATSESLSLAESLDQAVNGGVASQTTLAPATTETASSEPYEPETSLSEVPAEEAATSEAGVYETEPSEALLEGESPEG